jgi:hypothetical protein
MPANASLRRPLNRHARYIMANTPTLGYEEGTVNVTEEYPIEIETGEGVGTL